MTELSTAAVGLTIRFEMETEMQVAYSRNPYGESLLQL